MKDYHRMRAWDGENYWDLESPADLLTIRGKYCSDWQQVLKDGDLVWESCTGLKDKNGRLIYEGDQDRSGTIVFSNGAYWVYRKYAPYLLADIYHEIEIIGNIHQNPELLK